MEHALKPPLIVLAGPTAVGKTELSLKLAKAVGGEIVSADSMQVYRRMDIGTAKLAQEERQGIVHHLIDVLEPQEDFHAVAFQAMAKEAFQEIYHRGHIPVLAGGTGFYLQAVLYDIDFEEHGCDENIRQQLEARALSEGLQSLHRELAGVDPKAAEKIHPNNGKRVIRALEYFLQTGRRISEHNEQQQRRDSPYHAAYFVLSMDRAKLYKRIDERVDAMLAQGLVQEVENLVREGVSESSTAMQGIGYKEMLPYIRGECSLEEAACILKRDTRHFAKRQLTWFRRERDVLWMDRDQYSEEELLDRMLSVLEERGIAQRL